MSNKEIAVEPKKIMQEISEKRVSALGVFDPYCFEVAQRAAKALACSGITPEYFRESSKASFEQAMANCLIAMNMSMRFKCDLLMVMQNMYIINGKPAFQAKFLIAIFNGSKRFSRINYEFVGIENTDSWGCKASAIDSETGERLVGTKITIDMAKKEGWFDKAGSKWKTMPEQMLQYRSAKFFMDVHAPEITMGITTKEEAEDIVKEPVNVTPQSSTESLVERLKNRNASLSVKEETKIEESAIEEAETTTDDFDRGLDRLLPKE